MGNSAQTKLTDELFQLVLKGDELKTIDAKIEELKKEFKPDEWKLSKIIHPDWKCNLLHAACMKSMFHSALVKNKLDFIRKYIREFDINEQDALRKRTALMHACDYATDPAVCVSLPKKPNGGQTVLFYEDYLMTERERSTDAGNILTVSGDLIQELLMEGAHHDLKDIHGRTALTIAVDSNYLSAVEELCGAGAQLGVVDEQLRTPLMHAALVKGDLEIFASILARCSAEVRELEDKDGNTALQHAVNTNNFRTTSFMIKNRCDFTHNRAKLREQIMKHSNPLKDLLVLFADGTNFFSKSSGMGPELLGKTGNGLVDALLLQNIALINLFLDQGFSFTEPNEKLPKSASPLHVIASYDFKDARGEQLAVNILQLVFELQLKQEQNGGKSNMNWDVTDNQGKTVIDYCLAKNREVFERKHTGDTSDDDEDFDPTAAEKTEESVEESVDPSKTLVASQVAILLFLAMHAYSTKNYSRLDNLEHVVLEDCKFSRISQGMPALQGILRFDNVKKLRVVRPQNLAFLWTLTGDHFSALKTLKFQRATQLDDSSLLKYTTKCKNLKQLCFNNCNGSLLTLGSETLKALFHNLGELQLLDVRGVRTTDEQAQQLITDICALAPPFLDTVLVNKRARWYLFDDQRTTFPQVGNFDLEKEGLLLKYGDTFEFTRTTANLNILFVAKSQKRKEK